MAILWFSGSYLLIWWKSRYTGPGASPFSGTLSRSSAVSSNSPVWHNDRLGSYRMDLFFKPVWRKTTSGSIGYHDSCRNGLHPRNDHLWVCRSSRPSHRKWKNICGYCHSPMKSHPKKVPILRLLSLWFITIAGQMSPAGFEIPDCDDPP